MEGLLTAAELEALGLSLRVALVAVLAVLPFAFLCALLLARCQFRGKTLVDGLIHLPLVLPPVALGYLLLVSLGTRAPLGAWLLETFGIRFVFSWTGAALASAILTFPFQVRAIRLSLEAQDRGLAEAAETLGAGPLDRLFSLYCRWPCPASSPARSPPLPPVSASSAPSSPSSRTFPARPAPCRSRSTPRSRARRRGGGGAAGGALHRSCAGRARACGRPGAPRPRRARLMSAGSRHTAWRFRARRRVRIRRAAGRHGPVRAIWRGQDRPSSTRSPACCNPHRPHRARRRDAARHRSRHFVPARLRRIGVVFQDTRLFPHLTVRANSSMAGSARRSGSNRARIDAVIALLALEQCWSAVRAPLGRRKIARGVGPRAADEPARASAR